MLHSKFQVYKPSGPEEDIFEYFSIYFYDLNVGPHGRGTILDPGLIGCFLGLTAL